VAVVVVRYDVRPDFTLSKVTEVDVGPSPSFLAASADCKFLYATTEGPVFGQESAVVSCRIDAETGALDVVSTQNSCGSGCCHLEIDEGDGQVT